MSRRDDLLAEMQDRLRRGTDRMFLGLLVAQWIFAIILALAISPYSWVGATRSIHFHVKLAVVFGGLINALPIALIVLRPGWWLTRHSIAVVQILWSAMLIMITNGRIETHFHVFGSLAFLAFYRDWKVIGTATLVVVLDHLARGLVWPDSVYGIANPEWFRFLEHAGWVVFEDVILVIASLRSLREMQDAAAREARLERTKSLVERQVNERTAQLQETSERYRALIENTEAVTFEYDFVARRMLYLAPQAATMLECSLAALEDHTHLVGAIHRDDRPRLAQLVDQLADGSARATKDAIDFRMVTAEKRVIYLRAFVNALQSGRRIRGVVVDITRQKVLEAELQHAQKLESVGRLAAGVAHEINTPIQFVGDSVEFVQSSIVELMTVFEKQQLAVTSVVDGTPSLELAREAVAAMQAADTGYLFDQLPKAVARALDGVDRVATIVRSMKVFAHPDTSEMTKVDLDRSIGNTLTVARNEYRYVADLVTDYGGVTDVTCHGGAINQVVLNLLINAAHAVTEQFEHTGTRGKITVTTRYELGDAVISIADTGNGIPEHARERIFEPFFTTKQVGKGTGQGLAIARSIVERHKGKLTFETATGHGTTFVIRIPIAATAAATRAAA